jgi:hypothetical protein
MAVTHAAPVADARLRTGAVPLWLGGFVAIAGVTLNMCALAIAERLVTSFPRVPDPILSRLPYVNPGWPGEAYALLLMLSAVVLLVRDPAQHIPRTLVLVGIFYAIRGVFQLILPIGPPVGAPDISARFALYPFSAHGYFPAGHFGLMTLLILSLRDRSERRALFAGALIFAAGTMLARTHYAADSLGGALVAYAVSAWGERHLPA